MKKTLLVFAALAAAAAAGPALPAYAALPAGAHAPQFDATATLGGKTFDFNLDKTLRKGPVRCSTFFRPPSPRAAPSRRTTSPTPPTATDKLVARR